ncbi:MAG: hypothetical protein AAFX87_25460 [Bacteroidota bacterium]
MTHTFKSILILAISVFSLTTQAQDRKKAFHMLKKPITLAEVKQYALGEWESISIELRPTEDRTGSGKILPTYLKRNFKYMAGDKFIGTITLFADNYGKLPLMQFEFKGRLSWGGEHPIAKGAWQVDYVLDEGFGVTPLNDQAAAMLNQALPPGMPSFATNKKQDILQKAFPMFNIVEGQVVSDYDLIYFRNGMLFMGAKHVDGTPFDKPENRPHQLQIPLAKKY